MFFTKECEQILKYNVAQRIAALIQAIDNCKFNGNKEWEQKHKDKLAYIEKQYLPSGAGIDNGTQVDLEFSTPEKLVLKTSYHHMNDSGFYDNWTNHKVLIKPSLVYGLMISISGENKNDIKEYLHQTFMECLTQECSIEVFK